MDESTVREHAEAHGRAVVEGDLRRAAGDLTDEVRATAGDVMARLPRPLTGVEVASVEPSGDDYLARIRYSGESEARTVEARWTDAGDRPKIAELSVVEDS